MTSPVSFDTYPLKRPGLYIVSTPIGNLADITIRALEILKAVDVILAEDTRHSQKLLQHYAIRTSMWAYHEFNEQAQTPKLILELQAGKTMALITDAGTPLVNDPGYRLVSAAHHAGIPVVPIPGACAAIAALSVAGLATHSFAFEGFLPAKAGARRAHLEALRQEPRTLIFYETPHRLLACLRDMALVFGDDRKMVITRELTKSFESILRGRLVELIAQIETHTEHQKGEFVLVVSGARKNPTAEFDDNTLRVVALLQEALPTRQAAALAAELTGHSKNLLYRHMLK